jgi:hypothetical protein
MFSLTRGELEMVAFVFALIWSAGLLPRLGEWLGARVGKRAHDGQVRRQVRRQVQRQVRQVRRHGG